MFIFCIVVLGLLINNSTVSSLSKPSFLCFYHSSLQGLRFPPILVSILGRRKLRLSALLSLSPHLLSNFISVSIIFRTSTRGVTYETERKWHNKRKEESEDILYIHYRYLLKPRIPFSSHWEYFIRNPVILYFHRLFVSSQSHFDPSSTILDLQTQGVLSTQL